MNGAGGAILAAETNPDDYLGVGAKCLMEEGMSSLTAEQYGITSGILALKVLCMRYGYPRDCPTVLVWIDNEEALSRAQSADETPIQLKEFDSSDFCVKAIMQALIRETKKYVNIQFGKVKSHQIGDVTDLPFEANLNNKADELANWIKNTVNGPIQCLRLGEGTGFGIFNDQGILIKDIKAHIYMKVNGNSTQEYLMQKNRWSAEVFSSIDWIGIKRVLEALPIQKQMGRVQLMHHWQNTGEKKMLFANSSSKSKCEDIDTQKLREDLIQLDCKCPFNCRLQETRMHFMECEAQAAKTKQESLLKNLKLKMERYKIHEAIITYLIWGLRWTDNKRDPVYVGLMNNDITRKIMTAVRQQTQIGWCNVRRGFISSSWAGIQYMVDKYNNNASKEWNKLFVKWMMDVSWEMWQWRNQALHGSNIKEGREKKLKNLQDIVSVLFQRAERVKCLQDEDVRQLFKLNEEKRKRKGVVALETWTDMAGKVVQRAEEKLEHTRKNGLDKWLNRELTYQSSDVDGESHQYKENKNKQKKQTKQHFKHSPKSRWRLSSWRKKKKILRGTGNCPMWNLAGVINWVPVFTIGIG